MSHLHTPRTLALTDTLPLTETDALDVIEDSALIQDVIADFHTRELVSCEVWLPICRPAQDQLEGYVTL